MYIFCVKIYEDYCLEITRIKTKKDIILNRNHLQ